MTKTKMFWISDLKRGTITVMILFSQSRVSFLRLNRAGNVITENTATCENAWAEKYKEDN